MLNRAAKLVKEAEVFVITAGAGMGVDSGLPDFRGVEGFWNAYPAYRRIGVSFEECANPEQFARDPRFGWGFYGQRTNLYRETTPHAGFHVIRKWINESGGDYFIVTSNVDGHFQKAGFAEERVLEVHGSIHWLQCQTPCEERIWPNREIFDIDELSMLVKGELPRCRSCGRVSRPNILMFGDWKWLPDRTRRQEELFDLFMRRNSGRRIAVIELGAGTSIPTVRRLSERIGWGVENAHVIRINPREPEIMEPHVSIQAGALEGLERIDIELGSIRS